MRKTKNKRHKAPSFQSSRAGNEKFTPIYDSMLYSTAFKSLTNRQKLLLVYMNSKYGGANAKNHPENNPKAFYFNRHIYKDELLLYTNDSHFARDRDALIEKGFIICLDCGVNTRTKAVYRYSDMWQNYGTDRFYIDPKYMTVSLLNKLKKAENQPEEEM